MKKEESRSAQNEEFPLEACSSFPEDSSFIILNSSLKRACALSSYFFKLRQGSKNFVNKQERSAKIVRLRTGRLSDNEHHPLPEASLAAWHGLCLTVGKHCKH